MSEKNLECLSKFERCDCHDCCPSGNTCAVDIDDCCDICPAYAECHPDCDGYPIEDDE